MVLLETKSLTKEYSPGIGAIDINIKLNQGEILGFIGANGAGKTTTLAMLAGLIFPNKGSLTLLDKENVTPNNIYGLMPQVGIMMSDVEFEPDMSARKIFIQSSKLLLLKDQGAYEEMAAYLELPLDVKFKTLSTGNKKKVGIINALFHKPSIVIMDEPTSGLDPLIQQKLDDMLFEVKERGGAVLLSSHDLKKVEQMCDRIMIIRKGKIIIDSPKEELFNKTMRIFKIRKENLPKEILQFKGDKESVQYKGEFIIYTNRYSELIKLLNQHAVYDFLIEIPTIEELFIDKYK